MAFIHNLRHWSNRVAITSLLFLGSLTLLPAGVFAASYGGGVYGGCPYSQGCAPSAPAPSSNSTATTPAADQTTPVVLNNFSEYFTDGGKQLSLAAGQSVSVDLLTGGSVKRFNIGIATVGDNYVNLTLPNGSSDNQLLIGQTKEYDLNGDGKNDIKITLNSISGGKANLTFGAVLGASSTVKPNNNQPSTTSKSSHSWWLPILSGIAIVIAITIFIILWLRRRKQRNQQTGPWPQN